MCACVRACVHACVRACERATFGDLDQFRRMSRTDVFGSLAAKGGGLRKSWSSRTALRCVQQAGRRMLLVLEKK